MGGGLTVTVRGNREQRGEGDDVSLFVADVPCERQPFLHPDEVHQEEHRSHSVGTDGHGLCLQPAEQGMGSPSEHQLHQREADEDGEDGEDGGGGEDGDSHVAFSSAVLLTACFLPAELFPRVHPKPSTPNSEIFEGLN